MKIRKIQQSDFEELYVLWKKAQLNLAKVDIEKKEFSMMIQLNPTSCLVGIEDNKIVGGVFGIFNGRRAFIYHLAIDPDYQGKGLGSKLLEKTEEELKKVGATKIRTYVEFTNLKAAPFYQKNNYAVISEAVMLGKNLS